MGYRLRRSHGRLVVVGRGEDLLLLSRDGGVSFDQLGEDATLGLDPQRQRRHVQKKDIERSTAKVEHNDLLFGFHFVVTPSRKPLDRVDGLLRVGDGLSPRRFAASVSLSL